MPTKITGATIGDAISGSAEKRIDTAPDGTLWLLMVDPNKARFFYSTNGGSTWAYSTGSDFALGQYSGAPSFFIDADGFAHLSFQRFSTDPQVLTYGRGKPVSGRKGFSWTSVNVNPAGGRMGVDSDVVAFRNGDGWVAFALYNIPAGHRIARINISASGALSVGATSMAGITDGYINSYASLTFDHTGNGKTPSAAPHLYLVTGAMTSQTLRARRLRYESGNWTPEAWVNIATAQTITQTAMTSVFDGTRVVVMWSPNDATIDVAEWVPSTTTVTRRDPAVLPGSSGTIGGLSMAVDPATKDIYAVAYGYSTDNVFQNKLTRASSSWAASWTQVATRTSDAAGDGNVQLVRHAARSTVDLAYCDGPAGNYTLYYQQLATLTITPSAPALLKPSAGSQVDLTTNGGTFTWDYAEVGPGDTQASWAFRRTQGSTIQYWNDSAKSWSSTIVWNSGTAQSVNFPPAVWPTATYSWSVAATSANGGISPFASNRTVISTISPVVMVTAPIGLIYDTSNPTVEWSYAHSDPQRTFEIRLQLVNAATDPDNATQNVWTSGVVTSTLARSAIITQSLIPGVAYRAFVRATSSSSITSAWDYVEFALSLAPPSAPSIEVTEYAEYETGVPRARLELQALSNEMDRDQAQCITGWENGTGATLAFVQRDTLNQIEPGFALTSTVAGVSQARVVVGTPPAAPYGQPALLGPVNFPVIGGETYTLLASFKSAVNVRAARVFIRWLINLDGSANTGDNTVQQTVLATVGTGAIIPDSVGDQVPTSTTAYTQAFVTAVAPAKAVLGKAYVEVLNVPVGEVHYVTQASFHPGTSQVWQPGGYSFTETIRVERSDDGGKSWATLEERVKPDFTQHAITFDRSMPFGEEIQYRVTTDVDTAVGTVLSSETSLTAYATINSDLWALRDKAENDTEVLAYVTGHEYSDEDAAEVFRPAGREYAIVDSEGNQSREGTLKIYVPWKSAREMVSILRSGVPILVQSPSGTTFCARFLKRNYSIEDIASREISVDYVEVA